MRKAIILFFLMFVSISILAQTTVNPRVQNKNNPGIIERIVLTDEETIVYVKVPKQNTWGGWVQFSSATVLVPAEFWSIDEARQLNLEYPDFLPSAELAGLYQEAIKRIRAWRDTMSEAGWLIRGLGPDQLDTKYKSNKSDTYFELHFDRLPAALTWMLIKITFDLPRVSQ